MWRFSPNEKANSAIFSEFTVITNLLLFYSERFWEYFTSRIIEISIHLE